MSFISAGNTTTTTLVVNGDTTGNLVFNTGGANTTALTITNAQQVGIGTSVPSGPLSISYSANSSFNTGLSVSNTNAGSTASASFQLVNNLGYRAGAYLTSSTCPYYAGVNTFNIGSVESLDFAFITANTERMRITASASVLIGLTTPYSDGSIGQAALQTKSQSGSRVGMACIGDTTGTQSVVAYVNPNGTVGSVATSGSLTVYNTTSDYRLKENVTPILNALKSVAKLKPVDYTWKVDNIKGQGFIAHELQEVCPQAVTGTKDAVDKEGKPIHQGIDTSFLAGLLTAAIQELNAKVDAQAAEIAALKAGA